MPTVEIALILFVNAGASARYTQGTAWRQEASVSENADSVCECRKKSPAPTMCSPAAGSVWPPGIRIPTVEIALILFVKTLILFVNAGASA